MPHRPFFSLSLSLSPSSRLSPFPPFPDILAATSREIDETTFSTKRREDRLVTRHSSPAAKKRDSLRNLRGVVSAAFLANTPVIRTSLVFEVISYTSCESQLIG